MYWFWNILVVRLWAFVIFINLGKHYCGQLKEIRPKDIILMNSMKNSKETVVSFLVFSYFLKYHHERSINELSWDEMKEKKAINIYLAYIQFTKQKQFFLSLENSRSVLERDFIATCCLYIWTILLLKWER